MSCNTKTTRSAGLSRCNTTSRASRTLSSKVTRSAGSASSARVGRAAPSMSPGSRANSRRDLVQAQAAGHHYQPAALIVDLARTGAHQARERVLDDVFGGADVPEQ